MKVSQENPWYWELDGKPTLLLGGSDEDNIFNHPALMKRNLDTLAACGGNYIRCTLSSRDPGNVQPYESVGGRYDVYRFNREYWDRLDDCCREAARRGIVVQLELWATYDFFGDNWRRHPFNPANNVNYTSRNTTLPVDWPYATEEKPQPFFSTVPALNDDATVLAFQQSFVDKVLEVTLGFDNVLYCLDVDTSAPLEWAVFWGEYVQTEAARRGRAVNLTETWDLARLDDGVLADTYARPDLFDYLDISLNNRLSELEHWDAIVRLRGTLEATEAGPRPLNNVKVFATDSAGMLDMTVASDRFWQNILAGCASTRFRSVADGFRGLGLNANAQSVIRAARAFTNEFDVFHAEPSRHLLLETPRSGAYCSAQPGVQYAVYLPDGGAFRIDLSGGPRSLSVKWFDTREARFLPPRSVRGARPLSLSPPDLSMEWLTLIEAV